MTIHTDASDKGYGYANLETKTAGGGGEWHDSEKQCHINVKEMMAAEFGLKALCKDVTNKHIKIMSDNQTTVAYVREMGGSRSLACNTVARAIWHWAVARGNTLSIQHIPGVSNNEADSRSRHFRHETEWKLDSNIFQMVIKSVPAIAVDIDLFASRGNAQLEKYIAWMPDPFAIAIDAFSVDWGNLTPNIFPTFSQIPAVIKKLAADEATAIVIVPHWTT
jgi:hypothetical protein